MEILYNVDGIEVIPVITAFTSRRQRICACAASTNDMHHTRHGGHRS